MAVRKKKEVNQSSDHYYRLWSEAKTEIERLRNYYEVDFEKAFEKVREMKDLADHFWDQYEQSRGSTQHTVDTERQELYDICSQIKDLIARLEAKGKATGNREDDETKRLKSLIESLKNHVNQLWYEIEKI